MTLRKFLQKHSMFFLVVAVVVLVVLGGIIGAFLVQEYRKRTAADTPLDEYMMGKMRAGDTGRDIQKEIFDGRLQASSTLDTSFGHDAGMEDGTIEP